MQVLKNMFGLDKKIAASEIAIKNSNGEGVTLDEFLNTLDVYSTEEQVIGTWIDGKPLYRKVITFNSTIQANTEFSLAHNITNYERVWIDISNTFIYSDLFTSTMPAIGYYQSLTDKLNVYIYGDYVLFYSNGGWGEAWTKVVTLNYTKTTD